MPSPAGMGLGAGHDGLRQCGHRSGHSADASILYHIFYKT
jgi:hypothetical protein